MIPEAMVNTIKADGILEAVSQTRESMNKDGAEWLCRVADLTEHAKSLKD